MCIYKYAGWYILINIYIYFPLVDTDFYNLVFGCIWIYRYIIYIYGLLRMQEYLSKKNSYTHTSTHTSTHIYVYIGIYIYISNSCCCKKQELCCQKAFIRWWPWGQAWFQHHYHEPRPLSTVHYDTTRLYRVFFFSLNCGNAKCKLKDKFVFLGFNFKCVFRLMHAFWWPMSHAR